MSETTPPAAEQPVDPWLVDRLLADSTTVENGDDQTLASLIAALRSPAAPSELAERDHYLAAFAAAQTLRITTPKSRRKTMLAPLLAAKSIVASIALVTIAGTAAATYSGSLPSRLQDVAHQSIGAPAPASHQPKPSSLQPTPSSTSSPTPTPTRSPGSGPNATKPRVHGLCTAFEKGGLGSKSKARKALSEAAGGPSRIPEFCRGVLHEQPEATSRPRHSNQSGNRPTTQPSQPSQPSSKPSKASEPSGQPSQSDSQPSQQPTDQG